MALTPTDALITAARAHSAPYKTFYHSPNLSPKKGRHTLLRRAFSNVRQGPSASTCLSYARWQISIECPSEFALDAR